MIRNERETSLIAFIFRKCVGVKFLGRESMTMQILAKTGIRDLENEYRFRDIDVNTNTIKHEIIPFHARTKARVLSTNEVFTFLRFYFYRLSFFPFRKKNYFIKYQSPLNKHLTVKIISFFKDKNKKKKSENIKKKEETKTKTT